jgi:ferric-dicitrate binding protein FerR (iron transport regulator)
MTDPPEANGEHDAIVARMLTDGLATRPLKDGGIERLRAAVRLQWRETLSTDEQRPWWRLRGWQLGLAAAAGIVALAIGVISIMPSAERTAVGSLVRLNDGAVEIRSGLFRHRTLKPGDPLRIGDTVITHGSTLVRLARGGTLRIGAGTTLRVSQLSQLALERGLLYVDMPSESRTLNPLRITTSAGEVEHIGTEYEVMSDQRVVRIRVREGQIRFSSPSAMLVVDAGTELLANPGNPVSQRPVATFGRDWIWVSALAPDYEIDGKSLSEFLRWVGRELGRSLKFADAHAREVADSTILHGSVHGQGPSEALANVLGTTSLTYELRGDTIWVRSAPSNKP